MGYARAVAIQHTASPCERAVQIEEQGTAVMHVAALAVWKTAAEETLLDHVEDQHALAEVADVLRHHVELAGLLDRADERPAVVHRDCGGHFAEYSLSGPEGIDRHSRVIGDGRRDDDGVEVFAIEHPAVIGRALLSVIFGNRPASPDQDVPGVLRLPRSHVTDRDNVDVLGVCCQQRTRRPGRSQAARCRRSHQRRRWGRGLLGT